MLYLIVFNFYDIIIITIFSVRPFEPHLSHDIPDLPNRDLVRQVSTTNEDGDHRRIHLLGFLPTLRFPQPGTDELLLRADQAEGLVETLHPPLLPLVKPELEALLVLLPQLGVELFVVHVPLSGVIDMTHLKTQPAAVTRLVSQETLLIAGGTEGGEAGLQLTEQGIGASLVDALGSHQSFQLSHLSPLYRLYLLDLHQTILRNGELVILCRKRVMGILPGVATERLGQQVTEEGRLIDALFTDQGEHLVVRLFVIHLGSYHGDEPFMERPFDILLCLLRRLSVDDRFRHKMGGELMHPVFPVPWRQLVDIVTDRVDEDGEVTVQYTEHILRQYTLPRICLHLTPHRLHHPLVNKLELPLTRGLS